MNSCSTKKFRIYNNFRWYDLLSQKKWFFFRVFQRFIYKWKEYSIGPFLKTKHSKIYACLSPYLQFLDLAIDPMVKDPCVINNIVWSYLNIISYSSCLINIIYTSKHQSESNTYLLKNSVIQISYCFPFSQISVILGNTSLFLSLFNETLKVL